MAKLIISLEDIRSGRYAAYIMQEDYGYDVGMPWEPTTDSLRTDYKCGCPYCGSYEGDSQECPECGHGQ